MSTRSGGLDLLLVTDLNVRADEGMAVTVRSLTASARCAGLKTKLLAPPRLGAPAIASIWPLVAAVAIRTRSHGGVVAFVSRAGLTRSSALKAAVLSRLVGRPVVHLVLQAAERVEWVSPHVRHLVLSQGVADDLQKIGGHAEVTEIGIDRDRFSSVGDRDERLWPPGEGPRVLHVGHLKEGRNVLALSDLARDGCRCLLVASPSTQADPGLAERLERSEVKVHREHVDDLAAIYRAADVYVFPTSDPGHCTTVPLSVLEALACGTPVVTTAFGGIEEVLGGRPGLHISEPDDLARHVRLALETGSEGAAYGLPDWARTLADIQTAAEQRKSRLVVLVGLDGTGKSTQARLLVESARVRGYRADAVWARWDPFLLRPLRIAFHRFAGNRVGGPASADERKLSIKRRLFRSRVAQRVWLEVAALDHAFQVLPRIWRARRRNDLVICDRYYFDALVDMAVSFGASTSASGQAHRAFPSPDAVVLLDAPAEVVFDRKDDIPSIDHLVRRREVYLELANQWGWKVVDASQPVEIVQAALRDVLGTTT